MKTRSSAVSSSCVAGLSLLLVAGCVHTPQGYVAKEWSSSMRELGIIPVFPPREDVQVGDVYVSPVSPDAEVQTFKRKGFLPLGLWLTQLDVSTDVSSFYTNRPSFPITPSATADFMAGLSNSPFASLCQAQDTNRSILTGGDTSRLRMVGFPTFMSATFNKGDLAAVVPVEAVNLAFGGGFTSARSVTVSVPVAESYGVPADVIWPKIMNGNGNLMPLTKNIQLSQMHNLVNSRQVVRLGTNYYAPIRVITEVFYARALDISVASQTTRGFGVAGRPLATDAAGTAAKAVASAAGAAGSSSGGTVYVAPGVTNFGANAVERAAELNRSLEGTLSQTIPGGSLKFVAAGDRGVSLRRTYDRPIAIGYRALQLLLPIEPPNDTAVHRGPASGQTALYLGLAGGKTGWLPTSEGPAILSVKPSGNSGAGARPSGPAQPNGANLTPGKPVPPAR